MRGSPLKRAFMVAAMLLVVGFGLFRQTVVTSEAREQEDAGRIQEPVAGSSAKGQGIPARIRVSLSVGASSLSLMVGENAVELVRNSQGVYAGTTALETQGAVVYLKVSPEATAMEAGNPVFAKLVIEPEQHATITHVFDAAGEIDDFLEITF